ncbi:MAG: type I glyceraldehyde-3-phosphate dehydrogenase [Candidatus Magasanikbacteria bacterium]
MQNTKIAINGFGRIGRLAFRIAYQKGYDIAAINDLTDNETLAHLLKHDTAYPEFGPEVDYDENNIIIDGEKIEVLSEKEPSNLPWSELDVDIVLECTGVFRSKEDSQAHLDAGAEKVIISAPADNTTEYVRGVNCQSYNDEDIIDNASCTTNSTAPTARVMKEEFGIDKAMMSTIHSYTSSQNLQDGPHSDLRRARAAAENIVPTTTGAAKATTEVIPELEGKFDGVAFRVPTVTVSLTDFTFLLNQKVSVDEVNQAMRDYADDQLEGILDVTDEPLVSTDFRGNPYSAVVDSQMTRVVDGNLVKVVAWYDNEWGYANRLIEMLDIIS